MGPDMRAGGRGKDEPKTPKCLIFAKFENIRCFQFRKVFTGPSICDGWTKKLETLPDISFDCGFQKMLLSSLLLFP